MLIELGIIFFVAGLIFMLLPPKKINWFYGYRTSFTMKNQDIWNEAQRYSAITMIVVGMIYTVIGVFIEFVLNNIVKNISNEYQAIIVALGVVLMIIIDDLHLKNMFNSDGTRKTV